MPMKKHYYINKYSTHKLTPALAADPFQIDGSHLTIMEHALLYIPTIFFVQTAHKTLRYKLKS
jgi:hypothetical protein